MRLKNNHMDLTVYTDVSVFNALAAEWNTLAHSCASHNLFQTLEWQQAWWHALGEGQLHVLVLHEGDTLRGIAPLYFSKPGELNVIGHKEVTDYVDVIFAAGHEHACWDATLRHIAALQWTHFNFWNIPQASPTLTVLPELAIARGWTSEVTPEDVCPIIALPVTFDAYLNTLDGKERRELQRKLRRAEEDTLVTFATAATLDADVAAFIKLMKASRNDKDSFMTERMERWFGAICKTMSDAGWLELAFLEVEGDRSATYLNFVYDNKTLVYNSGLDPAKFGYLSPGQVLIAKLIETAIARKNTHFDFLQGNEEYKYKLGGKDLGVLAIKITR